MRTKITLAAACLACVCIMGCHDTKQTAHNNQPGAVMASGEMCPFSHKPANAKYTSTYNGQTVGFCCGGCKGRFDAMSDADKAKMCAK